MAKKYVVVEEGKIVYSTDRWFYVLKRLIKGSKGSLEVYERMKPNKKGKD